MPKISSAAADSRLLTRALISSALNILAEDRGSSEARWPAGVCQLEPGPSAPRWRDQISRDHPKHHAPSSVTFNLLPSTLFSLFPKFSLVPKPGEVFNKLIRTPEHFYCKNKDHDFVPEGRNCHSKGSRRPDDWRAADAGRCWATVVVACIYIYIYNNF